MKDTHERALAYVVVAFFIAVIVSILYWSWMRDRDDRQHCITTGGDVVEVHGGRGGWACLRPSALR